MRKFLFEMCATLMGAALCSAPGAFAAAKHDDNAARAKLAPQLALELSRAQAEGPANSRHDVLLRLKATADLRSISAQTSLLARPARIRAVQQSLIATARASQPRVVSELTNLGLDFTPYYVSNVIAVRAATSEQIMALAARSDIARISSDATVRVLPSAQAAWFNDRDFTAQGIEGGIVHTGADRVWSQLGVTGTGIVVGGQDTGIEWQHPALHKHYRGYRAGEAADHDYSWHDAIKRPLAATATANPCGYATKAPCDDNGHGSHTIGTIVGDDERGNRIGMAPGASWVGCRNMDAGLGKPSTYLECFQYFLAPWPFGGDPVKDGKPEMAPHIINNSWGCPTNEGCDGDDFLPVLSALKSAGIMVVVSAGNDGPGCSTIKDAPAHHSDLGFRVGAVNHRTGTIASFSSRGPSAFDSQIGPDITAPGVSIRSSVPGGGYSGFMWSGTSMAGPHVAGAIALLWAHDASYEHDIDRTIELFQRTATPKTSSQSCGGVPGTAIPNNTYGHGDLNAYKALMQSKS